MRKKEERNYYEYHRGRRGGKVGAGEPKKRIDEEWPRN
jgi:hypothetical protein